LADIFAILWIENSPKTGAAIKNNPFGLSITRNLNEKILTSSLILAITA
jgi:hypothetical protein